MLTAETFSYGPSGFGGLFSNYYASLCAAFAAMGGMIFGYDQVRCKESEY